MAEKNNELIYPELSKQEECIKIVKEAIWQELSSERGGEKIGKAAGESERECADN